MPAPPLRTPHPARIAAARQAFVEALPPARRRVGEQRFDRAGAVLVGALEALYGHAPDADRWLLGLCAGLGQLAAVRPEPLAALDAAREAQPDWFVRQRMLGYSAYVDRFGGTLAGVAGRIDHLRALGVDYLHLLPFLRARAGESDGGFAVSSFEEIEPALGSMAELEQLTTRLREAGISLCADLVLNHVADDHAWARAAMAGDADKRAFFHVFAERALPDAYEATLGEVFPQAAPGNFTHVPALDGWVWTTFYPFQWDLNYAHPPVFAAMAHAMLQLANRGVEVFRLDSAPFLWKRLGTTCLNQPEVHTVLAALRACTALVAPGVLLKAEAIVPAAQVLPYFGEGELRGRECQLAYHSGLMAGAWAALAEGSAALPRRLLAQTPAPPPDTGWITYVRCHDDIVWGVLRPLVEAHGGDFAQRIGGAAAFLEGRVAGSFARGAAFQAHDEHSVHGSNGMTASLLGLPDDPLAPIDPAALRRYALLHALALWVGAVPLLYMGDELGQPNNADPADAARIAADGRWLQRPQLSTTALALLAQQRGVPAATVGVLRALMTVRRDPRWAAATAPTLVEHPDPALLILRRGDDALGVFHFGRDEVPLDLAALDAGNGWNDAFASGAAAGGAVRTLAPWATLWRFRNRE
ncbi:alpha-amylase family glycosyl hydrolase [Dyella sp.]|uniref:alpha-amylase family glycosyl hydrolase n=1 Tax=Dyella sp. TaxID=1869338 RepID=UPI002D791481|nr:alpha-amylase family glycosyl hydrolase [Dyella sp.]HET6431680.1 alpha-amylase family glycosyl hydrolase [Dyella sp.]